MPRYSYGGKQHNNWLYFRELILEAKNRTTCEHCGVHLRYPIVHHLTYEWGIFNLNLNDYAILCNDCHEKIKQRIEVGLTAHAFVRIPLNETLLYDGIREGRCRPPGSNSRLRQEKRAKGLCEMSCKSCQGETKPCSDCGFNYCEYHLACHHAGRYKSEEYRTIQFLNSARNFLSRTNISFVLNQTQSCRVVASSHQ